MAKVFRPSNRESSILRKIESSREYARRSIISLAKDNSEKIANAVTMKLIEEKLVETTSKNIMENQINRCLNNLFQSNDFDIDYRIAPIRNIVERPNIVSLYITAFILEDLVNHKSIIDIYGTDTDIYVCINKQVNLILL